MIKDKLVVFDKSTVSSSYNKRAVEFEKTFAVIRDKDNNCYLIQRDLYAAAKMLFFYKVTEECVDEKSGRHYTKDVWVFDQKGFEKFFDEVFYPKHIEYIQYLIKARNLGVEINPIILGVNKNKNKNRKKNK